MLSPVSPMVNISEAATNNVDIVTIERASQVSYLQPGLINGTQGWNLFVVLLGPVEICLFVCLFVFLYLHLGYS